jgi:methyl-accepting chemotaxis protein
MKNMKLAVKLALGFGILAAIVLFLGSMAVWQMRIVGRDADQLSAVHLPMVKVSNEAINALKDARYGIRAYGLTGEDGYLENGLAELAATKGYVKESFALAEKYPVLAGMKDALKTITEKTAEYETLVAKTVQRDKEIESLHAKQDGAANQFMKQCYDFLASQNRAFGTLIQEMAPAANLTEQAKERLLKVTVINEIIDKGFQIRLANWKAQALRDPALLTGAEVHFVVVAKKIEELTPIIRQQENKDQLAALARAMEEYKEAMAQLAAAEVSLAALGVKRNAESDAALEATATITAAGMQRAAEVAVQSSANLARASRTMITGLLVAVLLSVFVTVYLTLGITRPILKGVEFANELARGNFSQRLDIEQRDEIGTLAGALNTVVENLQGQIKEIREAANVLASSASEISASVTQVTSGAQETAAAVTQTTSTVEEVKQTAHLTSRKSKAVADNAAQAVQTAHSGRKSTEAVAEGMNRINEQMAAIADTIVKLGEQSQAIGEITSTVDDIAEQSNLLAVNAAVEAAKAGEHGKGFAVVAQEIKTLAEQSKQATRQVRGILNDIQKATGAAVMATEQGSKAVDQGMKESLGASESIQTLTTSFSEAAQSAGQIAASTQEQLTGMDQVAMAMESIKEASQQNVASMQQLETAAQTLKDIGHKFTTLVGRYKV